MQDVALIPTEQHENHLQANEQTDLDTQMWKLFAEKAHRFTKGETSSMPEEVAEELMRSIQFTVLQAVPKQYIKQEDQWRFLQDVLQTKPLHMLYAQGKAHLETEVQKGKTLLRMAKKALPPFASVPCAEALQGISLFFKAYDIDFFAHRIPCDIDYQLAVSVPPSIEEGVVFINQYLKHLLTEFAFCNAVQTVNAKALLQEHIQNYRHEILNICEPLFINAIGCALAGANVQALKLNIQELALLDELLLSEYRGDINAKLQNACKAVLKVLDIKGAFAQIYFAQMAKNLINRITLLQGESRTENIFLLF